MGMLLLVCRIASQVVSKSSTECNQGSMHCFGSMYLSMNRRVIEAYLIGVSFNGRQSSALPQKATELGYRPRKAPFGC